MDRSKTIKMHSLLKGTSAENYVNNWGKSALENLKSQLLTARTENKKRKLLTRIKEWEDAHAKGDIDLEHFKE